MAISINWATKVIFVPKSYLTALGGERYRLDVNQFRLDLKDIEDGDEGMAFDDTHSHATEATLSGVTYARQVQIINGYTVEFENGTYQVECVGANHNIGDVKVVNSVSLIVGNSAGLITVVSGSGVTPADIEAIADKILSRSLAGGADGGRTVRDALRALRNRSGIAGEVLTVYAEDDATPAWTAAVQTGQRDPLTGIDPA